MADFSAFFGPAGVKVTDLSVFGGVSTAGSGLLPLVGVGALRAVESAFSLVPELAPGLPIMPGATGSSEESGALVFARGCRAGTVSGVSGVTGTAVLFDVWVLVDRPDSAGVPDSAGTSDPAGAVCSTGTPESLDVPDSTGAPGLVGAPGLAGATGCAGVAGALAGSGLTAFAGLCVTGAA